MPIQLRMTDLTRLAKAVESECQRMGVSPHDASVTLIADFLSPRRAIVTPDLWQKREVTGEHQDEPDPVTILF